MSDDAANGLYNTVDVSVGEAGSAGQAQSTGKEIFGHRTAIVGAVAEHRLYVHRAPQQTAFDAAGIKRTAQLFGSSADDVGGECYCGEPEIAVEIG